MAGVSIGMVTLKKVFHFGMFKMVAASSKLASIFLKTPPKRI